MPIKGTWAGLWRCAFGAKATVGFSQPVGTRRPVVEVQKQEVGMTMQEVLKRGLFMLLFAIAFGIAQVLLNVLAVVQFLWLLLTTAPNRFVLRFGASLSVWLADVARFLSCASDEKPFPWKEWPNAG
jgi:hypothetical protein